MITHTEYIAFLVEADGIRRELDALAPEQQLARLKEILSGSPAPYRLVLERLMIQGFEFDQGYYEEAAQRAGIQRDEEAIQVKPPPDLFAWIIRTLWKNKIGRMIAILVLVLVATYKIWASLPEPVKLLLLEFISGHKFNCPP